MPTAPQSKSFVSTSYCSVSDQACGGSFFFFTTGVATIVVIEILPKQLFNGNCQINFFTIVFFPFEFLLLLGNNLQPIREKYYWLPQDNSVKKFSINF